MSIEETASARVDGFPGEDFVEAREALGLGYEQLTRELRLPAKTLEAIEHGELKKLGGPVFVRGYIRTYAKRLKLDPNRYVAIFDELLGIRDKASRVKEVGTVSTSPARQSHSLMRFGSVVFVVAIAGFVIWWWQTQYSIDSVLAPQPDAPVTVDTADGNTLVLPAIDEQRITDPDSLPAPESSPVDEALPLIESQPVTDEGAPAMSDGGAAGAEGASGDAASGPVAVPAAGNVVDETAAPPEQDTAETDTPVGSAGLHLVLSGESWLSVRDATGRSLFNGIANADSDLNLQGAEPLSVVIGRADAVTLIEYEGEPVDLAAASDKNVARLTLPASQP